MDDYLEYLYALGLAERTIRVYGRALDRFWDWCVLEGVDPSRVSAISLAEYAQYLPMTHASRRQHRVALRHWFDSIGVDGPVKSIRVPPRPRYVSRALEPDEATRIVEASRGWFPEGTAMLFGLYLGLRRDEIARVRWDRFSRDLSWYRVLGKRDVEAELPVHDVLRCELDGRVSVFPWLFAGRRSAHIGAATVGTWCRRVGDAAGVRDLSPHRLRHTAIATINDETGDLRAAQEFARHADSSTTRIYTRVTAHRLERAVTALRYVA